MAQEIAVLAGGCFWCTEAVFLDLVGVQSVESGYTGGQLPNPTYKQVCGGDTGHAEAIRITFDNERLSYDDLLDIFFATHDPTQLNRQGNDVGTQYRSTIFPQNAEQEAKARAAIERNNRRPRWPHRHHHRADGRMVSGRGLPPGLLERRGPAEPLLPRGDSAQASETAEELPESCQIGNSAGVIPGLLRFKYEIVLAEQWVRASPRGTAAGGLPFC